MKQIAKQPNDIVKIVSKCNLVELIFCSKREQISCYINQRFITIYSREKIIAKNSDIFNIKELKVKGRIIFKNHEMNATAIVFNILQHQKMKKPCWNKIKNEGINKGIYLLN